MKGVCRVSVGCLEGVWRASGRWVSGRCPEGL